MQNLDVSLIGDLPDNGDGEEHSGMFYDKLYSFHGTNTASTARMISHACLALQGGVVRNHF